MISNTQQIKNLIPANVVWVPFKVAIQVLEVSDRTLRRKMQIRDSDGNTIIKKRRINEAGHIEFELCSLLEYKIKLNFR